MEKYNLKDFVKGWFIGNFEPTLFPTNDFEIAVKKYKAGDEEKKHHHKLATEFTLILEGIVSMNGKIFNVNDIIKIEPNESTDFKCLSDVITVVIKTPCIKNDKYINDDTIYKQMVDKYGDYTEEAALEYWTEKAKIDYDTVKNLIQHNENFLNKVTNNLTKNG